MNVQKRLRLLPDSPGVYLMKDLRGHVLYVGKASILRRRVASYFQESEKPDPRVRSMVRQIADFDTIMTDSEVEALVLESNLIKQYRPRYNVRLRDDKKYPFIRVTLKEEFPRVCITRTVRDDGSRYFGPYTDAGALRKTLKLIREVFRLASCNRDFSKSKDAQARACLDYDIGRCAAPCIGAVTREQYGELVRGAVLFLEGKQEVLATLLGKRMEEASGELRFELAAKIRDQLQAVRRVAERQKVAAMGRPDQDIIALAERADTACVSVFLIREGKLVGQQHFFLRGVRDRSQEEILASFLKQHYSTAGVIPGEIIVQNEVEESGIIRKWLAGRRGAGVQLAVPRRGEKKKLVDMAARNAELRLTESRLRSVRLPTTVSEAVQPARIALPRSLERAELKEDLRGEAVDELGRVLGLASPPSRIEAFDISDIGGQEPVGSMVVFETGKPDKASYRKFHIRSDRTRDDYAMMSEILERRYRRALDERQRLPDLILIDGGRGHLSAARKVLDKLGLGTVPAVALAKKWERIFALGRSEPLQLPRRSPALQLTQHIRDEAHRFAIGFHRRVRAPRMSESALDAINGVGEAKKQTLLRRFGSVEAIRAASVDEIARVPGVSQSLARRIKESLEYEGEASPG